MKFVTRLLTLRTVSLLILVAILAALTPAFLSTQSVAHAQETLAAPELTAEAVDATTVELSWTAVDGAARYELWAWDSVNKWRQLDDGSLTGTTYRDSGLTAATTYWYEIQAVDANGVYGDLSEYASATPGALPAPELTAEAVDATTVELSWTAVDGAARYELWAWDSVNKWRQLDDGSLTGTTYRDSGLTAATTYWYEIQAVDANGVYGDLSEYASATPGALPAPELTAEAVDATTVELSWTAVDGAARYELWAWDSVNKWRQLDDGSLTGTTYRDSGLTAATTYWYEVSAASASGDGVFWSELVSATPGAVSVANPDRAALVALYNATDGDNWKNKTNWLSEEPLNNWDGVTVGNSGRVIKLDLRANGLSGGIPSELGNLSNLTQLHLYSNQLSGEIPSELGNLTNLTELSLTGNQLSGAIPPELGNLSNLTELGLAGNQLSGAIPPELGKLTKLEKLYLAGNQLSGAIPPELGNLTNLKQLYLRGNQLTGCVPAVWQNNVAENDLNSLNLRFCAAPTPEKLTSAQIFAKVSPAVAFIQTATGTGSGVLIDGGYIVTNAHVVWPFDAVRVVFPDGSAFNQVPVKGWDLLVDLAVLGPINAPASPATLRSGENIPIGSEMYLIGYPLGIENADAPQPTITGGRLSRLRQWEHDGITYLQTDAAITGGQSGGAFVSDRGDVVGISTFSREGFGFSISSADLLPRIRQLIAGQDPSGLGVRRLPLSGGALRHELALRSDLDAYIINEPVGTAIEIDLSGPVDGGFRVFVSSGDELTDGKTGSFSFVVDREGPLFLILSQISTGFTLTSNRPLALFEDPDYARQIRVGESVRGNIDFPGDIDLFLLQLEENETVEIVVRSILADTFLEIGYQGGQVVSDNNSGGGLFGEDSKIVYRAPRSGTFFVEVRNDRIEALGGYVINVNRN